MDPAKKSIWTKRLKILVFIQACSSCLTPGLFLITGILGAKFAPDPKWSTIPMAFLVLGVASGGSIASHAMQVLGRTRGHQTGFSLGLMGIIICASSLFWPQFFLYCFANFFLGISVAFSQQIRFTAAEETLDRKGEVHSIILAATLFSAFLGPGAAVVGRSVVSTEFLGSLGLLSLFIVAALLGTFLLPDTNTNASSISETLRTSVSSRSYSRLEIVKNRSFWKGALPGMVAFATMSLIMSATPIQMHHIDHFSHADTTFAIQSHIFSMYFPSLFSGYLVRRWRIKDIIALGVLIFLASLLLGLIGHQFFNFLVSMILLGVAWNFLFLAGSTYISTRFTGPDRFVVQGTNDTFVFGTQAIASGVAGPLVLWLGWEWMMLAPIPLLLFLVYFHFKVQD